MNFVDIVKRTTNFGKQVMYKKYSFNQSIKVMRCKLVKRLI